MTNAMIKEGARLAPQITCEMAKPVVAASVGAVAARALASPLSRALRSPLLLLAAGAAIGCVGFKYRKEILQAVAKATDLGKDFFLQQKETLADLMAEAQEKNESEAKSSAPGGPPSVA